MLSERFISENHVNIFKNLEISHCNFEWYYNVLSKAFPLEYYIHWQQVLASILYLSFNSRELFMPFYTYSYFTLEHLQEHAKVSIQKLKEDDIPLLVQMQLDGCICFKNFAFLNKDNLFSVLPDVDDFEDLLGDIAYYRVKSMYVNSYNRYIYQPHLAPDMFDNQDSFFDFLNRGPKRIVKKTLLGDTVDLYSTRFNMSHIGIHTVDRIGALFEDLIHINNPTAHVSAFSIYLLTGNAHIISLADKFSSFSEPEYVHQAMDSCWRLFVDFWTEFDIKDIGQIRHLLRAINMNFFKIFKKVFGNALKNKEVFYIPIQDFLSRRDVSSAVMRRILRYLILVHRNPHYVELGLHYPAVYAYFQLICDDFGIVNNRDVYFDTFYSRATFSYPMKKMHWIYRYFINKLVIKKDISRPYIQIGSFLDPNVVARESSNLLWASLTASKGMSEEDFNIFLLNYLKLNSYDSFDYMCNLLSFLQKR